MRWLPWKRGSTRKWVVDNQLRAPPLGNPRAPLSLSRLPAAAATEVFPPAFLLMLPLRRRKKSCPGWSGEGARKRRPREGGEFL